MGRGNIAREAFGRVGAEERLAGVGSFELQLETPNAASSPSEITVPATGSGYQTISLLLSFFLSRITINTSVCQT
jgi:hypothetical protein